MGDVVLLFAQLDARLGEREGADWIRKRRGTRTVIRREGRFVAVTLRGRVRGFGEERGGISRGGRSRWRRRGGEG